MRIGPFVAFLVAAAVVVSSARAASLTTETFAASANGWVDIEGGSFSSMEGGHDAGIGNPAGSLRSEGAASLSPPLVDDGLMAVAGSSGGAFVGDYLAAGAEMIGFDVYVSSTGAVSSVPRIQVRLRDVAQTNFAIYEIVGANIPSYQWTRFALPLVRGTNRWFTPGNDATFSNLLSNVGQLRIELRPTTVPLAYYIDNVFLAPLHRGSSVASTNGVDVTWGPLRVSQAYRMEYSEDPLGATWTLVTNFTAASETAVITDPGATGVASRIYRLVLP